MDGWALEIGSRWTGAGAALGLLATAFAVGLGLLRVSGSRAWRQPADAALIAIVLGLDALAMSMLVSGWVRLPPTWAMRLGLGLGTAAAAWLLWRHRSALAALLRRLRRRRLAVAIGAILLFMLARAFCYPVGWDELVYHYTVPDRWLHDGRVTVYLDNPYSALPSAYELLFVLAMGAGNAVSASALHIGVYLLVGGCLYRLLRRWSRPGAAATLTVALLFSNVALTLANETYVELFLVAHLLAALLLLRHRSRDRRFGPLLLLAALAAMACGVKPTGVVVGLVLVPLAWPCLRAIGWRRTVLAALVAATIVLAWYARPWVQTGNPLYPFYGRVFTPESQLAVLVSDYHHHLASSRYGGRGWQSLLSPVTLAWERKVFDGALGWQWLVVLALAAWGFCRQPRRWPLAVAGLLAYVLWLATAQQSRFVLPAALFAFLLAGPAMARLRRWSRATAIAALLVLTLYSSRCWEYRNIHDQWRVLAGSISMNDYVQPWIGYDAVDAIRAVHQRTPPGARVLLLGDKRAFYLDRDVRLGMPFLQEPYLTPPELFAYPTAMPGYFRRHRIDAVLIVLTVRDPDRLGPYQARMNSLIAALGAARRQQLLPALHARPPDVLLLQVP